ncbi:hypothetical protein WR25_14781 [Diploscapter pachys]|uniref:Uncharacterized protein n=1 Tax=Diploscapter pachys TaxID=2018661 RepID=A0A2A2LHP9_9BILA|nr:hypothetical protein WR25_14781 [Diploscapter pachys]
MASANESGSGRSASDEAMRTAIWSPNEDVHGQMQAGEQKPDRPSYYGHGEFDPFNSNGLSSQQMRGEAYESTWSAMSSTSPPVNYRSYMDFTPPMPKIVRLTLSDDGLADSSNDSDDDNERTASSISSVEPEQTTESITDGEGANSGESWQNSDLTAVSFHSEVTYYEPNRRIEIVSWKEKDLVVSDAESVTTAVDSSVDYSHYSDPPSVTEIEVETQ